MTRKVKWSRATLERIEIFKTVQGLLAIAKLAMPDTYYMTDRRIIRAYRLLKRLGDLERIV